MLNVVAASNIFSPYFSGSLLQEIVALAELWHLSPKTLKLDDLLPYVLPGVSLGRQPILTLIYT